LKECAEIAEREKKSKAVKVTLLQKVLLITSKKYGDVQEMIESVRPVVALKMLRL
jgi:hypothetical protein